jgi:uncharacterized protein (TIGR02147 family)
MSNVARRVVARCLKSDFKQRVGRNPSYSLRAFARDLGISAGAASEILSGVRPLSRRFIRTVLPRLPLSAKTKESVEVLLKLETGGAPLAYEAIEASDEINEIRYQILASGLHFAILSLTETADFRSDPAWIARRLGVDLKRTEEALGRLEALGYLTRLKDQYVVGSPRYKSSDGVPLSALRLAHKETLELAARAVDDCPIEKRQVSSITMAIDPDKLSLAKEMIAEFFDQLSILLESGEKREVYCFSQQLFPLSKE